MSDSDRLARVVAVATLGATAWIGYNGHNSIQQVQEQLKNQSEQLRIQERDFETRFHELAFDVTASSAGDLRIVRSAGTHDPVIDATRITPYIIDRASRQPREGTPVNVTLRRDHETASGQVAYYVDDFVSEICRMQRLSEPCGIKNIKEIKVSLYFDETVVTSYANGVPSS